jgi:hypothetical protein
MTDEENRKRSKIFKNPNPKQLQRNETHESISLFESEPLDCFGF